MTTAQRAALLRMPTRPRELPAFDMRHFELVAPAVTNAGDPSGYPDAVADALDAAGIGWTSVESVGSWHGKREAGRTFTVFAMDDILPRLARIGRAAMPDQDAIQVTEYAPVRLIEA